jgi:hypothetical protein
MKFKELCWVFFAMVVLFIGCSYENPWVAFLGCMMAVKAVGSVLLNVYVESFELNEKILREESEKTKLEAEKPTLSEETFIPDIPKVPVEDSCQFIWVEPQQKYPIILSVNLARA